MLKNLSLVGIVLLSALSNPSFAGKLYKWVDKNGVTHFSQTPPPEEETKAATERVEVRDTRALKPRKEGRHLYCGNERLRNFGDRPAVKIANFEQYLIDLNRNLGSLQERRAEAVARAWQYKKAGYSDDVRRYDNQIEVEQCKIDWAKSELAGLGDERNKIAERVNTVNAAVEEIEQRKVAACGVDNRTGFVKVDDTYRAYKQCIVPFDREISKLRREQRRVETDHKIVEGR
jgi:chromosome segregation ATPase